MNKKLNCVLLVDDDEATNFLNKMVITKSGITEHIETVLNGKEAIEYITSNGKYANQEHFYPKPKIIFLDINMPVMDGWEFIVAYKNLDEEVKDKMIIVMLTTSFNPDDKLKADGIPEITMLRNKPLSYDAIQEIVETYFEEYV
jgi:CheY-like chemotaxis protein